MSADNNKKPTCLIGLFGLSRTFKQTSQMLFQKLIDPNKDKYDFDIIINTDFENKGCTSARPDTHSGVSTYKYKNIEDFKNDLYKIYNKYNQLQDILLYNYDNTVSVWSWCLVYKRIQLILQSAFKNKKVYDIYIMLRMDSVIDNILDLDTIKNEVLIITGVTTRSFFFHNRDTDLVICGNYKPFMYWVLNVIKLFDSLVSKNKLTENFFSKEPICENIIINEMNEELSSMENSMQYKTDEDIEKIVQLRHTPFDLLDSYHEKNSTIINSINYCQRYDITNNKLFKIMLNYIRLILFTKSSFILSENKQPPIYSDIIR